MSINNPILITGVPRSGSTLIARIINFCGAFGGQMSKRGMYRNDNIHDLVQLYIQAKKVGLGYHPINWKSSVEYIIRSEGYIKGEWMYKDSELCQMWDIWNNNFPTAKWIIVRRRPNDIIESCLKTGYMTAYNDREGWLKWIHFHEKIFVKMIEAGLNCKQIWPERMVNGDYQQIIEMIEWLNLIWKPEIVDVIDPLLWNSKQKEKKGA